MLTNYKGNERNGGSVRSSVKKYFCIILSLVVVSNMFSGMNLFEIFSPTEIYAATQGDSIANYALSQVGKKERSKNSDNIIYNDWYYGHTVTNSYSGQYSWCQVFVSYCANQCGISTDIIPKTASCKAAVSWFSNRGRYKTRTSGYRPQVGDIIFFQTVNPGTANHVGIVYATDNSYVYYVDGNNTTTSPHGVARSKKALSNSSILGYGVPAYNNVSAQNSVTSAPIINSVQITSIDSSHVSLHTNVSNAGLVRIVAISKTTGQQTTTDFTSNLDNVNYTFNTSSMTNPGKDYYIRIYAYTTTSGGNETLHEVTYGDAVGSVRLPNLEMLNNVDLMPSELITTGRVAGWVIGENPIERVTVVVNGTEYECDRVERDDVKAAFPNYNTSKAGFDIELNAAWARNGENSLTIRAYTSGNNYVDIYNGSFQAVRLDDAYFDCNWYYLKYHKTDSEIAAIGQDPERLKEHYFAKGIAKGYSPNIGFEPSWYCKKNPDINQTMLDAYKHFVMYTLGNGELRDCSPYFSMQYYKAINKDLQNMTSAELLKHYLEYGCQESRPGSSTSAAMALAKMFNAAEYAKNNEDIKNAFGNGKNRESNLLLWNHWLTYGIKEKRISSDKFNLTYYVTKYGITDGETAFWRYIDSGYANHEITCKVDEPVLTPTPTSSTIIIPIQIQKPSASSVPSQAPSASAVPRQTPSVSAVPRQTSSVSAVPSQAPSATVIPDNAPQIIVSREYGKAGDEIPVTVRISNNPGITSMTLNLEYDRENLTLVRVQNEGLLVGATFTNSTDINAGPYKMIWNIGTEDVTSDGKLVTLLFRVKDCAMDGSYTVRVSYEEDDIYNTKLDNVKFYTVDGNITLADTGRGDVNGDGRINTKDATLIMQYYAGWDVEINLNAADMNGDDKVNTKDATLIMQYYAGWDVELK